MSGTKACEWLLYRFSDSRGICEKTAQVPVEAGTETHLKTIQSIKGREHPSRRQEVHNGV